MIDEQIPNSSRSSMKRPTVITLIVVFLSAVRVGECQAFAQRTNKHGSRKRICRASQDYFRRRMAS